MPRRPRIDKPGRLHHVMSRGQDGRSIFEATEDYRFFLLLLVRAIRAGRIVLHTYSLMSNHFHLLVESVDGELSRTMQWVLFRYAAYFNLKHKHNGHVFGQRFKSFAVLSCAYLFILLRYIDRNSWKAKKRRDPLRFPWCSAFHHAQEGPRPRWLERRIIDEFLRTGLLLHGDRWNAYRSVFGLEQVARVEDELVEGRMRGQGRGPDPLDHLILADPAELSAWLLHLTQDTEEPTSPIALTDAGSVLQAVSSKRNAILEALPGTCLQDVQDPEILISTGLLRDVVGVTYEVAAGIQDCSASTLGRRYRRHREGLADDAYRALVANVLHAALERAFSDDVRRAAREGLGIHRAE